MWVEDSGKHGSEETKCGFQFSGRTNQYSVLNNTEDYEVIDSSWRRVLISLSIEMLEKVSHKTCHFYHASHAKCKCKYCIKHKLD